MSGYKRNVLSRVNSQWEAALRHREISSVLCDDPEGRDGVGEGGRLKGEGNMTGGFQESHNHCLPSS